MKVKLTDSEWQKILPVLKSGPEIRLGVGRALPSFSRCCPLASPLRGTMALAAEAIRQLELRL